MILGQASLSPDYSWVVFVVDGWRFWVGGCGGGPSLGDDGLADGFWVATTEQGCQQRWTVCRTTRQVGRPGQAELRRINTRRQLTITSAATLINRNRHVAG